MARVISSEVFTRNLDKAKFHRHDEMAAGMRDSLSGQDRIKLRFGPIQVGEIDFGEWPEDDKRHGTPRRLPLYLFEHGDHVSADYAHGFPGHNERVTCHCGHNHYFASSRFREIRALCAFTWFLIRNRKSRTVA